MFVYVVGIGLDLLLGEEVVAFGPAAALVVAGIIGVTSLEFELLVLAPRVDVVDTAHTHTRTAVAVHVVGAEPKRGLRFLAEEVQVAVGAAVVLGALLLARLETVKCVHLAEYGRLHLVVRDDVYCLVAVAVVDTREFGLVTQLIEHLDRLDGLGRYGLYGRSHVVAEELAAVDKDLLHGFALYLYRAAVDVDARHLREQLVGVCIRHDLVCRCVVDECVAVDGSTHGLRDDIHRLDPRGVLFHGPCRYGEVFPCGDLYLLRDCFVSEERCREAVFACSDTLELVCAAYG